MRALPSLLLAGAVASGGMLLAPASAQADGGWRGRHYYDRYYAPSPPRAYYGPRYYAPPPAYYRPPPPVYYRAPPPAFYAPPPAFYGGPPPAFYGGVPRSYGIPPGPGVGLFLR